MTPPGCRGSRLPLRWSQLGLAKQCTFTAAARRQRRGERPRKHSHSHNHSRSHAARALRPRASRQSPPHHEQGISELAALG